MKSSGNGITRKNANRFIDNLLAFSFYTICTTWLCKLNCVMLYSHSQQFKPVSKFYRQLLCNGSPVSQWHGPFLAYIAVSEVNQFLKGGVVREHALVFCHFPYLAMLALNCICGINHTAYIRCELEVFSKFFPVVLP